MIIDEKQELKILKEGKNKKISPIKAIWLLAKEQALIDGKERRNMIKAIEEVLDEKINGKYRICRDYNKVKHFRDIENIVDKCRKNKYKLKVIESIYISKKELDEIIKLRNLTLQRLAFAFLFNAKVEDAKRGEKFNDKGEEIPFNNYVYKKTGVLFGESISSKKYSKVEKEIMTGELVRDGYLELKNVHSKSALYRKVLFLDKEASEENHELKISYFDNYIYEFDNYIGEGDFKRCEGMGCGKIIKLGKTKPPKYCKECAEDEIKRRDRERKMAIK